MEGRIRYFFLNARAYSNPITTIHQNDVDNSNTSKPNLTIAAIVNKRVGQCSDGLYKVIYNSSDTSGNISLGQYYFVEKDTVSPKEPIVNATKFEG